MSPTVRGPVALLAAAAIAAGLAVAQPWLAGRAHVLNWAACLCDPGGDDQFLLITTFLLWFQVIAVAAGALAGRLLRGGATALADQVPLVLAAALGALAGVPVAVAAAEAVASRPPWHGQPSVGAVREAALVGIVVGAAAAIAAVRSAGATTSLLLTGLWGWLLGWGSGIRPDADSTPALGAPSGYPPRLAALACMALACATLAWWLSRTRRSRPAAAYAPTVGPALVLAAYLGAGMPTQNLRGFENAVGLLLVAVLAGVGGAALGARGGTSGQRLLDRLTVVAAAGGIVLAALAGLAPMIYGPAPLRGSLVDAVLFVTVLVTPFLSVATQRLAELPGDSVPASPDAPPGSSARVRRGARR